MILFWEIESVLIVSVCLPGTQQPSAGSGSLSACLPACVQSTALDHRAESLLWQTVSETSPFISSCEKANAKARWLPLIKHGDATWFRQVEHWARSGIPAVSTGVGGGRLHFKIKHV